MISLTPALELDRMGTHTAFNLFQFDEPVLGGLGRDMAAREKDSVIGREQKK